MNKNSIGILLVVLGLLFSCVDHNTFNSKTQFKKDKATISSYVAGDVTVIPTDDGIWYAIDTVGLGIYPIISDSVKLEYTISDIPSGKQLYTTYGLHNDAVEFKLLSSIIAGLQFGLPKFPVGSYGRIYIPSGLAYGTTGNPALGVDSNQNLNVGPNANLLFTIKLVAAKGSHFSSDTAAVTKYLGTVAGTILADNGGKGKFVKDPSGIRYWYDTLYADSLHPNLTNHKTIELTYKAKVFNAVNYFQDYGRFPFRLDTAVAAWKIILPKISKGSKVQIFVPSGYGFGSNITKPPIPRDVSISIPANSNLVYEIELDSVY